MELVKILTLEIKTKTIEGNTFFYIDLGEQRISKRIWLNNKYLFDKLNSKRKVIGVFENAKIVKTSKEKYIIQNGKNNIFFILVKSGYRGCSEIKVLSNYINIIEFFNYHSPKGSIGTSNGVIVETKKDYVKIQWNRRGRLYGGPDKGLSIIYLSDYRIETLDYLDDIETNEIRSEILSKE